ncbi:carbon-nitrogen hydrolase [Crateriforma conspicua]|nr:carbon-nitrogen hydrolase [Crateriforma conspicua]
MTKNVRLALVQMRDQGSAFACVDQAEKQIHAAAADGANVVCLQELFNGPYPCQSEDHRRFDDAEPIPGPTVNRLAGIAKELGVVIVAPIFERRGPGMYHNSAAVLDTDGSLAGVYRKMHIPDDPLFYEKFYFTPGDAGGFQPIQTSVARLGVAICWDQWFPETARLLSLAGAEILLYPTAIGWIDEEKAEFGAAQRDAWITVMRSHAICNGVFLGAPNRIGVEGKLEFWGSSFVASPTGQLLGQLSDHEEGILITDCQLPQIDVVRTHWPFLRDRRIDDYGDLTRRWIDHHDTTTKRCG